MAKIRGMTLLELLFALAITAILLGVATPAMSEFMTQQRLTAAANDTLGVLLHPRGSSTNQGAIMICIKGSRCRGRKPGAGIIAYTDANGNRRRDDNEPVIAQTGGAEGIEWQWRSFRNKPWLRYQQGGLSYYQNGSFTLCLNEEGRRVVVNWVGRPRVTRSLPTGGCQPKGKDA